MKFSKWLIIAAGLFLFGLLFGLLIPAGDAGMTAGEAEVFEMLAEILAPLPPVFMFLFIFVKNVSVLVISFIFSPLFCLVPAATLVINGGFIGVFSRVVIGETSVVYLLAGLLPHGILEIPALLIGLAATLSFGTAVVRGVMKREQKELILPNLRHNFKYIGISTCLFMAAAIIETWITPVLLRMVE